MMSLSSKQPSKKAETHSILPKQPSKKTEMHSILPKQPSRKAETHSRPPKQPLGVNFQPQSMPHSHPREGESTIILVKKRQETLYHGKNIKIL